MRLQKYLADQGLGSRRQIEEWIREGRLCVNGQLAHLGIKVDHSCQIELDGEKIQQKTQRHFELRVLCYHKPEGKICTRFDPEGRPNVFEDLPRLGTGRWIQVGRLDLNTSGLILFTNFGELAHRLMHPKYEIEREYAVRVLGEVTELQIREMKKGVEIEPGKIVRFESIEFEGGEGANKWYRVILREGQNREVRRIWETQNILVSRLIRIRYADVFLPRLLPRGRCEELNNEQKMGLLTQVQLPTNLLTG